MEMPTMGWRCKLCEKICIIWEDKMLLPGYLV